MNAHVYPATSRENRLALSDAELHQLHEKGYLGPYTLFDADETARVLHAINAYPSSMLPWIKGGHAIIKEMYQTAVQPGIVEKVKSILGTNVLLWGSQLIHQKPSTNHRWHLDVEHGEWEGATIWLAMKNVSVDSGLTIITGTHRFEVTPQELEAKTGLDLSDDQAVLAAARKIAPDCELIYPDMKDGQFIIFSGKAWHGSRNLTDKNRAAIIFQYTRPESQVKIADSYDYPHVRWDSSRPPCILVHGQDTYGYNRLIDSSHIGSVKERVLGLFVYFPKKCIKQFRKLVKNKLAAKPSLVKA